MFVRLRLVFSFAFSFVVEFQQKDIKLIFKSRAKHNRLIMALDRLEKQRVARHRVVRPLMLISCKQCNAAAL